ncbi:MAG: hypothetical protein ACR2QC_10255 [Gammaproteobacteria bacterium]
MYFCTPSATVCAFGEEIPAFAGMELKRFRLSPEWRILIKRLKVPPFRRKFILANAGTGISLREAQRFVCGE